MSLRTSLDNLGTRDVDVNPALPELIKLLFWIIERINVHENV